jgi:ribonuclease G
VPAEIICNRTGREMRVALLEDGHLAELHVDRGGDRGTVGNIYLGRVVRVLPGMQAAFVDIGLDRAAFLYVGDIHPGSVQQRDEADENDDDDDAEEPTEGESRPQRSRPQRAGLPNIQDLITEGQEIIVQVAKDPIGTKGARITTHVAIPGRYLVYLPTVDHVGISRRIEKDKERRRLRELVTRTRRPGAGYIVRTVCETQTSDALRADMEYLEKTWDRLSESVSTRKAPAMLHEEVGLLLRSVRDLTDTEVTRVVVDDVQTYEEVRAFMADFLPAARERVHLYKGAEPIFDTYGVETEIHRALGRKVWLKSGGYLVIDQAEALMAIDVNSGRYVGSSSLEDTTLKINLEAVTEVVYQLRLRNMGGLIIIDFIDMDREGSREKVFAALNEALKKDRARTNALKISELGLVEMTRKRVQEGLDRYLTEDCPTCKGTGRLRGRSTLVYDLFRELRREAHRSQSSTTLLVDVHPTLADLLYGEHYDELDALERSLGRAVVVRPVAHRHPEQFEVVAR